jgi:hypothetical protein
MDRFRLVHARSEQEIAAAAEFRRRAFFDRRGVQLDEALEAQRDQEGHVFVLVEATAIVATGRILPFPSRLSPVLELKRDHYDDADDAATFPKGDSEIGRIAAVPSPSTASYALMMLTLGSVWLLRNTGFRRYLAFCHPKLVELYKLVGAEDTGRECLVPGRDKPYKIVGGTYFDAARLGVALLGETSQLETVKRSA